MAARGVLYRTTIADSWRWMRLDLLIRLAPLTIVPLIFIRLTGTPVTALGVTLAHPIRDLLVSIPLALAGFVIAAWFAEYLARRRRHWFVPDGPDLAVQSVYYLALNAPIEELFFRGFMQGGLSRWWNAPAAAVVVTTAVFGAYHLLDRWDWRPVIGATAAGLALGLIYLWQPQPPSLLTVTLVHGTITCGFLSLGPYVIYRWRLARQSLQISPEVVRK